MSSGVEFEGDNMQYSKKTGTPGGAGSGSFGNPGMNGGQPKMVRWLLKKGIVKNPGAAQGILVAVIIMNIIITYLIISYIL